MSTSLEPASVPTEMGKTLSACLVCRLIKTYRQFYEDGCENCPFLDMKENEDRCSECTTPAFQGTLSIIDPSASWTAKWTHSTKFAPGVYALAVQGTVSEEIEGILNGNNINWHRRPT